MKRLNLFSSKIDVSIFFLHFLVGRTGDSRRWTGAGTELTALAVCPRYSSKLSGF